jgi:hypothetical protein
MKLAALSALALSAVLAPAAATAPERPVLSFPLACEPGRTCEIQHYVDRDPGPGTRDYRCGPKTYEKHSGIDIRVLDMAAQRRGVNVLAAAPGRVARLRDGVVERTIGQPGAADVNTQECGNGVVIDHGDGWETQYCHMARGSIAVKVGDEVAAGRPLGKVGLSGKTEFPHLHLTVRHKGQMVDPFAPDMSNPAACTAQTGLWSPAALAKMPYKAGEVLNAGFTQAQVTMADVENAAVQPFNASSPWLIFYVRAIALLPGDETELVLKAPGGAVLTQVRNPALANWRAQDLRLIGKRRPPTGWPPGVYAADYRVWRKGKVAISRQVTQRL